MDHTITMKNKRIWTFYNTHKVVSIESVNLMMIDLMERILNETTSTDISLLTNHVKALQSQVQCVTEQIQDVSGHIHKSNTELSTVLSLKLNDIKREYITDVKDILSSNCSDKIYPMLRDHSSTIMDKTKLLLNELIPSNQEHIKQHMHTELSHLKDSLLLDTQKLVGNTNHEIIHEYIANIDKKFTAIFLATTSSLSNTEHKLESGLKEIRSSNENDFTRLKEITQQNQEQVQSILYKMENSSGKGQLSQNILASIIEKLYPSGQIDEVGNQTATGDIMLRRTDCPTILIENKNWDKNVVQEEVKKFIRDIELQNCCGLFLSQNSGIANKKHFEINIDRGNIIVYIHCVNNDAFIIKTGIDIIDRLKERLVMMDSKESTTISTELLDEINQEYSQYMIQKDYMKKTLKDLTTKLSKQLDDFNLPSLDKYLGSLYASSKATDIKPCIYCTTFIPKNSGSSLSAHLRGCKAYHDYQKTHASIEVDVIPKKSPNKTT